MPPKAAPIHKGQRPSGGVAPPSPLAHRIRTLAERQGGWEEKAGLGEGEAGRFARGKAGRILGLSPQPPKAKRQARQRARNGPRIAFDSKVEEKAWLSSKTYSWGWIFSKTCVTC